MFTSFLVWKPCWVQTASPWQNLTVKVLLAQSYVTVPPLPLDAASVSGGGWSALPLLSDGATAAAQGTQGQHQEECLCQFRKECRNVQQCLPPIMSSIEATAAPSKRAIAAGAAAAASILCIIIGVGGSVTAAE